TELLVLLPPHIISGATASSGTEGFFAGTVPKGYRDSDVNPAEAKQEEAKDAGGAEMPRIKAFREELSPQEIQAKDDALLMKGPRYDSN
ncbi:MAG: hypothetical protein PHR11_04185, partial [Candidatus Omnitrophica bacterium]|nr:hypothetical protein [Candidatus Omnitrophota bacterium]